MFFRLIENRRSKRKFRTDPVEKDKVDKLVEAALRAPSSRGLNPWRFIVVDDPPLLSKLSESKPHGAAFLKNAPLGIVVCGDKEKSDVWVEDTSIAAIFIHLAAEALELGSCWIQIRKRTRHSTETAGEYVKKLLTIPEHLEVASIIAIGYPDETKPAHSNDSLEQHKVSYNTYG